MKIIHKNWLVIGLAITASSAFSGSPSDSESKEVNFLVMNWTPKKINYSVSIPVDPRERSWHGKYDFSEEVNPDGGMIDQLFNANKHPVILDYIENKEGICETEGFEFPVVVKNYDVFVVSNDATDLKACLVKKQSRTTE
jgi:hypothetical protein